MTIEKRALDALALNVARDPDAVAHEAAAESLCPAVMTPQGRTDAPISHAVPPVAIGPPGYEVDERGVPVAFPDDPLARAGALVAQMRADLSEQITKTVLNHCEHFTREQRDSIVNSLGRDSGAEARALLALEDTARAVWRGARLNAWGRREVHQTLLLELETAIARLDAARGSTKPPDASGAAS